MYIIPLAFIIIIICATWILDWHKKKIINYFLKLCVKEKVIPVFVVPLPNYRLDMDDIPVQVKQILI